MKFLMDVSQAASVRNGIWPHTLVAGQLITPLTRYRKWCHVYAIDNGAFGGFREKDFFSLLDREHGNQDHCLFVCCPDKVGDHAETLAMFAKWSGKIADRGWKRAFVAQDGATPETVPWDEIACLFVGGKDPWKDSKEVEALLKAAQEREKHTHVGRVNAVDRFLHFLKLDVDTCDGSGVARYSNEKLPRLLKAAQTYGQ